MIHKRGLNHVVKIMGIVEPNVQQSIVGKFVVIDVNPIRSPEDYRSNGCI